MVYPIYAQKWNLTPTVTTLIFAVYPIVVVVVLTLFGDLSDHFGRRRTMAAGLAFSAMGVLLFAIAANVGTLLGGRVLMGIGVGLSAGPSTAALLEYAGANGVSRASSATIIGQATGYACALLFGGLLTQYAPFPTRLSFFVLLILLLMLLVATLLLPESELVPSKTTWKPTLPKVPPDVRSTFLVASIIVMTAYTHGVTITSLGAQIAKDLVQSTNIFTNSVVLALFPITLGGTGLISKRLSGQTASIAGAVLSIIGSLFLVGAVLKHTLLLFIPATAISGAGYATMVYGGLSLITAKAPKESRGGILSAVYLMAYLFTGVLAVILGKIATIFGMSAAAFGVAATMFALCVFVVVLISTRHSVATASSPDNA